MQPVLPSSLFEGVAAAACSALGIDNLESRRAAARWRPEEATDVAAAMYAVILRNYQLSGASARRDRSRENWRWSLQSGISAANTSPEVVLERAIARACVESGRDDWANQVPVASGLGSDTGDRRRALDLVRRVGAGHYEFIELKIGSNTPLSAAVELLGYACLWLLARGDPPATARELLKARKVDLRVLAPEAFYRDFPASAAEALLQAGVCRLGAAAGVEMSFAFEVLPSTLTGRSPPSGCDVLEELSGRCRKSESPA